MNFQTAADIDNYAFSYINTLIINPHGRPIGTNIGIGIVYVRDRGIDIDDTVSIEIPSIIVKYIFTLQIKMNEQRSRPIIRNCIEFKRNRRCHIDTFSFCQINFDLISIVKIDDSVH